MSRWLTQIFNIIPKSPKGNMSEAPPARPMKYPYTLTAKVAQFPYKYYYTHSWGVKYGLFGIILTLPIFYKIQKLSKSPENVTKWKEIRRKQFSGEVHH